MSDIQLRKAVEAELEFEPRVNAAHIGVIVQDGVVTLTGWAESYAGRLYAERAARRVKGVRGIAEEIEVRLPGGASTNDDEIAGRALKLLEWDMRIPTSRIQIKVERGRVTLDGAVEWQFQREAAEAAIRKLQGVVYVSNLITVCAPAATGDIKRQIEAALHRYAEVEADNVRVEVEDGRVVLRGDIQDWHEREVIVQAAWSVPGVIDVRDALQFGDAKPAAA